MTLVTDTRAFLSGLAANNTRDWFEAHRGTYEADLRDPARALLARFAPALQELTGYPVATKLFRINRDVRFSKDKTPYNTHLHMMWSVQAGARQDPVFFFGIGRDYVTAGTGIMAFEAEVLADWRKVVDLDGGRIAGVIAGVSDKGYAVGGISPALRRVPAPYPQDHPHGTLLKLKGLTMSGEIGALDDVEAPLLKAFADLWPVADMLIGIAEAPVV